MVAILNFPIFPSIRIHMAYNATSHDKSIADGIGGSIVDDTPTPH